MKIVTTHHITNPRFMGLIASLTVIEPQTIMWLPQQKPIFDVFDEMRPDIFICTSEDFTPELTAALQEYKIDTIIFGLHHPQEITPKLLLCDNIPEKILENIQTPTYNLLPAANTAQFTKGKKHLKYESDVLYISNSNINIDIELPILQAVSTSKFKFKICGPQVIPLPQYIGQANIQNLSNLLVSTKIVIDFNENILWDVAFNKTFCLLHIPTKVNIPTLYPTFTSASELLENIKRFISSNSYRTSFTKKAYKQAINNTYFHRLIDIAKKMNIDEWIVKCEEQIGALQ